MYRLGITKGDIFWCIKTTITLHFKIHLILTVQNTNTINRFWDGTDHMIALLSPYYLITFDLITWLFELKTGWTFKNIPIDELPSRAVPKCTLDYILVMIYDIITCDLELS